MVSERNRGTGDALRSAVLLLALLVCIALGAGAVDSAFDGAKRDSMDWGALSASAPPAEPAVHLEAPNDPAAPATPRRTSSSPLLMRNGFVSVQVNVDEFGNNILDDAANEPTIAVDPTNPNRIVICWRQFDSVESDFRQAGRAYSRTAGLIWTFPGVIDPGVFRSDPVLDADADGNFYFYSLTTDGGLYTCQLFISADGGVSWTEPITAYGGDKAWVAIDRTGGIGHGNFYAAWDYAGCCGDNWFTRSTDGGAAFDYPVPIPEEPIWGQTTVGPDGAVYVTGRRSSTNEEFVVVKSTSVQFPDAPLAFDFAVEVNLGGVHRYYLQYGPNPAGLLGNVCIAADHSSGPTRGYVYVLASVDPPGPDPLDVMIIRSTDGGVNWSTPVRVNDDAVGTNAWQWFGVLAVAPDGRLDAVWNDTRNDANPSNPTYSELYYAFSTDAAETWSESIPVSPPFNHFLGYPQQDKLGDYYDMESDAVGANVAYAATFNGEEDVYFLRIGDFDCNGNGIGDTQDIAEGTSDDINGNGIPDECECLGDLDGDWDIDLSDLAQLLSNYGTTGGAAYEDGDIDGDGDVDLADLAALLSAYGTTCD
jgi:hypothetical protein